MNIGELQRIGHDLAKKPESFQRVTCLLKELSYISHIKVYEHLIESCLLAHVECHELIEAYSKNEKSGDIQAVRHVLFSYTETKNKG